MNLMLILWLMLFMALAVLGFARPAWGVALYMMTFFASPPYWWWGRSVMEYRWSLYGGILLLAAVIFSGNIATAFHGNSRIRLVTWAVIGMALNATVVTYLFASQLEIGMRQYLQVLKFALLFLLIVAAIRTPADLRVILLSIVIGACYIGFEATINHRGKVVSGRLEGIGAPEAAGANQLASVMITVLPIAGTLFIAGNRSEKLLAIIASPLILNVVLLCNSRGAFLATLIEGAVFLLATPPRLRKQTLMLTALGSCALFLLLGDERIIHRFKTTFAAESERDNSAASRLDYWKAGLQMVRDYPLGAGGDHFSRVHGPRYIAATSYVDFDKRSVHNGYINETCQWGVQGILLRSAFIAGTVLIFWQIVRCPQADGDVGPRLLALGLLTGTLGYLVSSMFGDFLDNEWGYWVAALAVAMAHIFPRSESPEVAARPVPFRTSESVPVPMAPVA